MNRYYTRACNFYYGPHSKILVKKKKTIPLHGLDEISFDQIEIKTKKIKKRILVKEIKNLPKKLKIKINLKKKKISKKKKKLFKFKF